MLSPKLWLKNGAEPYPTSAEILPHASGIYIFSNNMPTFHYIIIIICTPLYMSISISTLSISVTLSLTLAGGCAHGRHRYLHVVIVISSICMNCSGCRHDMLEMVQRFVFDSMHSRRSLCVTYIFFSRYTKKTT